LRSRAVLLRQIDATDHQIDRLVYELYGLTDAEIAHTLPPTAPVDGLLGLDFVRSQQLTIDFRAGQIELA
jgi:hypothetical protein